MRISKIFEKIAKSQSVQNFYKWASSPGKDKFLNQNIPQIETILATSAYCYSTAKADMPKEKKTLLQIQNVGSGVAGLLIAGAANRYVGKKTEEIIKDIDTTKLDPKALRKVSTGLRVFMPIFVTACVMRLCVPTAVSWISGKVMDKKREQGLNVKA